jgi:hypothetical protein
LRGAEEKFLHGILLIIKNIRRGQFWQPAGFRKRASEDPGPTLRLSGQQLESLQKTRKPDQKKSGFPDHKILRQVPEAAKEMPSPGRAKHATFREPRYKEPTLRMADPKSFPNRLVVWAVLCWQR